MSEIVLPRLGWTMEHGVFMGWLKQPGESVKAGEPLFTIEGDKSVQEVEAIESGFVRIAANAPKVGDTVAVGTVIGHIEQLAEFLPPSPIASPSVRRLARELEIDLTTVTGSGPRGRIREEDVRPQERTSTPRARKTAREKQIDIAHVNGTGRNGRIRERDVLSASASKSPVAVEGSQISSLRKTIAQRLVHSLRTTAPVTLHATVDATNLVNLREQFQTIAAGTELPVPGFTDFIIKLTAIALQKHPSLNSRWHDDRIAMMTDIHIGLAVDTDAGLIVPVIRDVPTRTIRQLATLTNAIIEKARQRKLTPDEMQGGTFTVTNLGAFGIDAFTPIINWPECAILGIGAIRKQPMVVNDTIVARHTATLSLTFDHRIVDGAPAARFLQTLCQSIENPSAWLVE